MLCVLIGTGSIGRRHARVLRSLVPGVEIVALRSGHGGDLPPGIVDRQIEDREAALAMRPDCAIVADPAPMHSTSAIPLIRAGIPVLLEKPIAIDLQGAQALLAASHENSRILVGYVLRHYPALQYFHEALRGGMAGQLVTLHLEAGQSLASWRPGQDVHASISARRETGGGVIFELSHEIDAALWLLGEVEVVQSLAATRGELPLDVEDTALILLRCAAGALALVQIDMARGAATRRYRAIGTKGTLVWTASSGRVHFENGDDIEVLHDSPADRDEMFRLQMEHFLMVVRGEAAPLCTLADGANALAVVLAARRKAGLDAAAA